MKEALAERLLAQVMGWTPEDVSNERPLLQAMAALKYDEYQQFAPGIRFVESLALWLRQFETNEERLTAYKFVKSKLVFFSAAEIAHLVSIAYPDHIQPLLIRRAAEIIGGGSQNQIARIAHSKEYRSLRRQCLFLGLSDGARIDTFRRATNPELSHEQIWQTYEMSDEKSKSILKKLQEDISTINGESSTTASTLFKMVFLLDDFSGSGRTYLRKDDDGSKIDGKIAKFMDLLKAPHSLSKLLVQNNLYLGIVLYIATQRAIDHLQAHLHEMLDGQQGLIFGIHVVHLLSNKVCLNAERDSDFLSLSQKYYDPDAEDEHTKKGGTDVRCGFSGCALPLVLSHNTPNNSMFLLWANPDQHLVRGLFPRISRHRSET